MRLSVELAGSVASAAVRERPSGPAPFVAACIVALAVRTFYYIGFFRQPRQMNAAYNMCLPIVRGAHQSYFAGK